MSIVTPRPSIRGVSDNRLLSLEVETNKQSSPLVEITTTITWRHIENECVFDASLAKKITTFI